MAVYVALLRAVNVGSSSRIKMDALRAVCARLGLANASTYLQSGNVVFQSERADPGALTHELAAAIERDLGVTSAVLLRSLDELSEVIAHNPFPERLDQPSRLLVTFLAEPPAPEAVAALQQAHSGPEVFDVRGREAYVYYPNGAGRSKLSGALIEKKLRAVGTARNWNTVAQLAALGASLAAPPSAG